MRPVLRVLVACALLAGAACSDGGDPAGAARGRFQAQPRSSGAPAKKPASRQPIPLPRTLPPASMFLGAASYRTSPSKYCLRGECAALSPAQPNQLAGPAGAPVLFSLSAGPWAARLEVRASGESQPAVVALSPGPSIAWQATLIPGVYALTLVATYAETEVSWPFELRVR